MQVNITKTLAREDITIFPNELVHLSMAELMKHEYHKKHHACSKVISAGFVDIISATCYGKSESLNIKSRNDKDTALLISGQYGANIVDIKP